MAEKDHIATNNPEFFANLAKGDEQAFGIVFKIYYAIMFQFAKKFVGSDTEAEDVTENVFLKLLEEDTHFNDATHLKAYLFRAVRHACLNARKMAVRKTHRDRAFATWDANEEHDYLAQLARAEAMLQLRQAVANLPTQAKKVITLTYFEGMTNQEAADALELSVQTIKNQKLRALSLLRTRLTDEQFLLLLSLAALNY
ncbi:RNA polymerase sigma factor [Parapedobacter tibetensis]|uniref:RNA polymerase sigma factor n=1 Tax=Parapedobacter tibetensis TaxID=2972951 RepID=UPI00214DC12D|nr:sigma-70 family RNA polymerase sigma factor [Parapedobacter tibetensis]